MKHHKPMSTARADVPLPLAPGADLNQSRIDITPSPDEVARKAYFTYMNEGSVQGYDVQHWLDAEAEIVQERDRTRIHGFHHRT